MSALKLDSSVTLQAFLRPDFVNVLAIIVDFLLTEHTLRLWLEASPTDGIL